MSLVLGSFFYGCALFVFLIGLLSLLSPRHTLFLLSEEKQEDALASGRYLAMARTGGVLMVAICTPLMLLFARLVLAMPL
ncbi:MAG: hypothetical protein ACOCX4_10475 [Planctomycetota bacterium]